MNKVRRKKYGVWNRKLVIFLSLLFLTTCYLLPATTLAQDTTEYTLLTPIEFVESSPGKATANSYIPGFIKLIIAIAGGLAVIQIIFGGIKYMSTDAFIGKGDARTTIQNAIWGLALVLSAWLILFTLNPKLVTFDFSIEPVEVGSDSNFDLGKLLDVADSEGDTDGDTNSLTYEGVRVQEILVESGIQYAGNITLNGVRQIILDEIILLKEACDAYYKNTDQNCAVVVTSATGGSHSTKGTCNHANGYKIDLRRKGEGAALTSYVTESGNFLYISKRSDGANVYKNLKTGGLYALESDHWDVAKCR